MPKVQMLTRPVAALPELEIIGTADFVAAHQGLTEHDHGPCLEIVVFDRGRNSYTADGREFQMTGGEFFVTPPHLVHSSGDKPQDKARHAWIQINLSPPRGKTRFLDSAQGALLRTRLAAVPLMKGRAAPDLYPQLVTLCSQLQALAARKTVDGKSHPHPDSLALFDLRTRLARFLLDFLASVDAASSSALHAAPTPHASPAIHQAIAYMQQNLSAPLAVRHMAQVSGYTESAFKQAFRRETGLSPADYFLRLKLDEAKRRLRASPVPITTLAIDLGFASGQYFATAFRRLTLMTPSAWRRHHGKNSPRRV